MVLRNKKLQYLSNIKKTFKFSLTWKIYVLLSNMKIMNEKYENDFI